MDPVRLTERDPVTLIYRTIGCPIVFIQLTMVLPLSSKPSSIAAVPTYRLEEFTDEPSQTLSRLLKKNHASFAVLRDPRLLFHNHIPHVLGSSYLLGATPEKLEGIFAREAKELRPIDEVDIQDGVTRENWRDFLGQKGYTVAYMKFFDSEVKKCHGDWKAALHDYIYAGQEPLINGFSEGLGHPFIHLAYAYEFDSPEVATEALSLGCTEYDIMHQFIDVSRPDTSNYHTIKLEDVFRRTREDDGFKGLFELPGFNNIATILSNRESAVLRHWSGWTAQGEPIQQLEECMYAATLTLINSATSAGEYDFFLAHILTVGHALRVLFPLMPAEHQNTVMREYGLYCVLVYIAQLCPKVDQTPLDAEVSKDCSWDLVCKQTLDSDFAYDVHFAKVVRALKTADETWGARGDLYLKAAHLFVSKFSGWTGFGLGTDAIP
ncbi:putative MGS207 protein [Seiridium cardinale]